MKMSRRAKRMERHHKRSKGTPGFNMVSLMDIFTILVFFLLVNSGEGEVLPSAKDVALPESISEQKPRQNIVVMVTDKEILVQGTRILRVSNIPDDGKLTIEPLRYALEAKNKRRIIKTSNQKVAPPEVTIMGSKEIPYQLLKKVMATCTDAGFGKISLAVLQKPAQES
ncbi:biopolymer transport protein ExbD [Thiogranum longum]|uniref:Biopolymer transport protein ExbD n=1 Tax=Thiogranum longum TaxID=1537524 RepID=A0A4R1H776_9GAMM|nr:biopolymer transporter ExbD [Thiogranum longum]TCK17048.1 biopolymer transport protein ExbD [Thiogranum longum]